MIQKIKNGLKKRKVKVFLIFLLCSTLAWLISKLSETYVNDTVFDLRYVNIPEDQMLMHASHDHINVKLEGVGFQFLRFGNKKIEIDLSKAIKEGDDFFISQKVYNKQIEMQLSNGTKLLELSSDTLFFDFQKVIERKVPIKAHIEVDLAQNYLLEGELLLEPDSMIVKGPKNEVDTILHVNSEKIDLRGLDADFSKNIRLIKSELLTNTKYSKEEVTISGKVSKFSEIDFEVKIQVINLPEKVNIKLYPNQVTILCKGSIKTLKELKQEDFHVIVDYKKITNESKSLPLIVRRRPSDLHSAILQKSEVEYILERR